MDEIAKNVLKNVIRVTDEDMAKVPRHAEKMLANAAKAMGAKLIAEATSSKYCFAQIKVGDKIVFDPFLNAKESTCPLCPMALIPVLISVQQAYERCLELLSRNIDDLDELNDSIFAGIAGCLDPGLEGGGVGHVNFKLYIEKR